MKSSVFVSAYAIFTFNYDRHLRFFTPTSGTNTVNAERQDGKILQFTQPTANGPWVAQSNITAKLTEQKDAFGGRTGWLYASQEDDQLEQYDVQGRLLWIQNRAGLRQTMNRDINTGRLLSVTDPFGRQLQFAYQTNGGLLDFATLPGGGNVTYTYTAAQAQPNASLLATVEYPDNRNVSMLYNEPAHTNSAFGSDFLTGIVDENSNRFQTYDYIGNYQGAQQNWPAAAYQGGEFK